jgi:type 1 glutamine amidotransferase
MCAHLVCRSSAWLLFITLLVAAGGAYASSAAPLRALLVTGGCCHDYAAQKEVLKAGIEARAKVTVDILYSPDTSTAPPIAIYGNPDYAKGYDVVVHDECASDIKDPAIIEAVLAPHRGGTPAVVLHCGVHSYRSAPDVTKPVEAGTPESLWFDFLGVQSSGHGPQLPITISLPDSPSPIVAGLGGWVTGKEELYNNVALREGVQVLARGIQEPDKRPGYTNAAVVWTIEHGKDKTRVFATSLGHNTETVSDPRYLDLVTRGLLWACGR